MKSRAMLFCTGFLQVSLVSLNIWQVANGKYLSGALVSFLISFVWTLNVKRVAFGKMGDRVVYAGGAMCGFLAGIALSHLMYGGGA